MDRGMIIFVGALITFSSSWLGLVLLPYSQLEFQQPWVNPATPEVAYPVALQGRPLEGQKVYQREGCLYCHSQQVRSEHFGNWWEDGEMRTGADIKRGWGIRRTVSRDYLHDRPVLLGTMRTGPDLATIGRRNKSYQWQHTHLLNARCQNGWSVMPSFPWLYTREKVVGERSEKALDIGREWTVEPGYRWRPSDAEWQAILASKKDTILAAFTASNANKKPDEVKAEFEAQIADAAGRKRLLEYWLTTREEEYQVVPTSDGEALFEYLLALDKNAGDVPEAKE
jgi:cytochrome c oxidase cbb3-type subunit 2